MEKWVTLLNVVGLTGGLKGALTGLESCLDQISVLTGHNRRTDPGKKDPEFCKKGVKIGDVTGRKRRVGKNRGSKVGGVTDLTGPFHQAAVRVRATGRRVRMKSDSGLGKEVI